MVSSFSLWNWSESCSPAWTTMTLPQYRSVEAKTSSYPQGLSTRFTSTANLSRSRRFGDISLISTVLTQPADESQGLLRRHDLFGPPQVLRRVDREPEAGVPERAHPALGREV